VSCPRALAIYGTIARFLDRKEVAGLHTHKASRAGFARAPTSCFVGSNPPARCEQTARPKFVDLMGFGHCLSKATSGIAVAAKPLRSNTTEHGVDSLRLYLRLAEREIAGRFGCVRYRQAVGDTAVGSCRRKRCFSRKVRNAHGSTVVPCALRQRLDASVQQSGTWAERLGRVRQPMQVCIHRPSRRRSPCQPKPTNCGRALQPASAGRLARSEDRLARRAAAPLGGKR